MMIVKCYSYFYALLNQFEDGEIAVFHNYTLYRLAEYCMIIWIATLYETIYDRIKRCIYLIVQKILSL